MPVFTSFGNVTKSTAPFFSPPLLLGCIGRAAAAVADWTRAARLQSVVAALLSMRCAWRREMLP